jgi:hypothetical protein
VIHRCVYDTYQEKHCSNDGIGRWYARDRFFHDGWYLCDCHKEEIFEIWDKSPKEVVLLEFYRVHESSP